MIPVVLIHSGFQEYVSCAVQQAAKKNNVYLLGDIKPELKLDNFEFVHTDGLKDGTKEFGLNYVHMNTTPFEFELFCFYRWFILRNFMKEKNIDVVFYIDSDVLLFSDVSKEWSKYSQYDMTLLHRTAAVSSYVTYRGICNFCDMIQKIYSNKQDYPFRKISSHFATRQECGLNGGVCDMTLLEWFHYDHDSGGGPGRVGEMMQILEDSTYDHNILARDQDFSFENGMKSIKIIDKMPYVFNEKLKKYIKFNSIHFNSGAKVFMKRIYDLCK